MYNVKTGYLYYRCFKSFPNRELNKDPIHPLTREFYEKYLADEGVRGSNLSCEHYPCHQHPQNCTFCYCPFYPCGDFSTGGRFIKKKVWDCAECTWIHRDDVVGCIQSKLNKIIEKVEDLQEKKDKLLEIRNQCLTL